LADVEEIILPSQQPNRVHSWHLYGIRLKLNRLKISRAQFIDRLKSAGIGISVHYLPLHMHPYYRNRYGYKPEDLPTAATAYEQAISLPIYPGLGHNEVHYVCDQIKQIIARHLWSKRPRTIAPKHVPVPVTSVPVYAAKT
jgi:perosamine synthetase